MHALPQPVLHPDARPRVSRIAAIRTTVIASAALACLLAASVCVADAPFAEAILIQSGFENSRYVEVGDLDGDGDVDIIASAPVDDTVAFFENSGDAGSFTRHDISTTLVAAYGVAVGDLDGDGDLDVIGCAFAGDQVVWWQNDLATGTVCGSSFCEHEIDGLAAGAFVVSVVDLDRDGDLDLVAGLRLQGGRVVWYENALGDASSWTRSEIATFIDVQTVAVGDLDGDGDLDVLAASTGGKGNFVWHENGFDAPGDCATDWCTHVLDTGRTEGVNVADLDGDGDLDLLRGLRSSGTYWWENVLGDATSWTEHQITTSDTLIGELSAVDLDGDGDLDILDGQRSPQQWIENTAGDASAWTARPFTGILGEPDFAAADLDGDGDLDVAAASFVDDRVVWIRNESLHRSAAMGAGASVGSGYDGDTAVGDIDGDGDIDTVTGDRKAMELRWSENQGDGTFADHVVAGADVDGAFAQVGDVDGDGDLDIVASFGVENRIYWYENDGMPTGGAWTENAIAGLVGEPGHLALVDLDLDGDLDVVASLRFDQEVRWFINDGMPAGGDWYTMTLASGIDDLGEIAAGDIDGDGDIDIAIASGDDSEVLWLESDGTPADGGWSQHTAGETIALVRALNLCDVDADGDLDIAAAGEAADEVLWLENDGAPAAGLWTKRSIATAFDGAGDVQCLDLDADGDVDVFAAAGEGDVVAAFLSDGSPADGGWQQSDVATFGGPRSIHGADIDRDGRVDVVASSVDAESVQWWRNVGGQFALPTADALSADLFSEGDSDVALLRIDGEHRGRAGDGDAEIATLELLFEEAPGDPLAGAELDALVSALRLVLDDGDEIFDPLLDVAVTELAAPFDLAGGLLTLELPDGDPAVQLAIGAGKTFFLAADLDPGASTAVPNVFQVTHATSASSTGEMSSTDIALLLEGQDDVTSSTVEVNTPPVVATPLGEATATEGTPGTIDVAPSFEEPQGQILSFDAAGLPATFSISSGGTITGTASTLELAASPYTVTVTASDPLGLSVQGVLTLILEDDPDALLVDGFESGDASGWSITVGEDAP